MSRPFSLICANPITADAYDVENVVEARVFDHNVVAKLADGKFKTVPYVDLLDARYDDGDAVPYFIGEAEYENEHFDPYALIEDEHFSYDDYEYEDDDYRHLND